MDITRQGKTAGSLRVVNDTTERAEALSNLYSGSLAKDEKQYQCLIQGVKLHLKPFLNGKKTSLIAIFLAFHN